MEHIAVQSKDIAIIGYDQKKRLLEVAFRSGGVYHYSDVPEDIFRSFVNAPSKGTFFASAIKDQYSASKIR